MPSLSLALVGLLAAAGAPAPPQLALVHVTVIDPASSTVSPDMTVVIQGDAITQVGPSAEIPPPPGSRVVNAGGKYLIPGLWDAHVHLSWATQSALATLVANGVTGVRDMGSQLSQLDEWRAKIASRALVGPRIVRAGPILNGQQFNQYQVAITTPGEAKGAVRALKAAGVDFLKVHRRMPSATFFALLDEAQKEGLAVVGHVPMEVAPEDVAGRLATIEHAETLFEGVFASRLGEMSLSTGIQRFRDDGLVALAKRLVATHVPLTPTLVAHRSVLDLSGPEAGRDPRREYVAASRIRELEKMPRPGASDLAEWAAVHGQLRAVVTELHRQGVVLLVGTDLAGPRVPGFTVHDELALLVDCGLSPQQALLAATSTPASLFAPKLGAVAPGRLADLVLLDANPLRDIRHTQRIHAVVLAGRLLDRRALDDLLDEGRAAAAQS